MSEKKSCLVVDDSMVARMIIIDFIKQNGVDWDFDQAANGEEALKKLGDNKFDYVTLDYNMPIMTGIEVLKHRKSVFPETKSVLLTANVQEHTSTEAAEQEVKCFHKPVTQDVVKAIVEYFTE